MLPSRGMGAINPNKVSKKIQRKDAHVPVKVYCAGGMAKGGGVNKAGNYTKPSMRKALFNKIKASATQGTKAGQWSARKAQLLAKQYKAKGGGYRD